MTAAALRVGKVKRASACKPMCGKKTGGWGLRGAQTSNFHSTVSCMPLAEKPAATVTVRGSQAESAASAPGGAGLQAAVWTRLLILMPLLPLVYADRELKPELNLRTALVRALVRWKRISFTAYHGSAHPFASPLHSSVRSQVDEASSDGWRDQARVLPICMAARTAVNRSMATK